MEEGTGECPYCREDFELGYELFRHKTFECSARWERAQKKRTHECPVQDCGRAFYRRSNLWKHVEECRTAAAAATARLEDGKSA